MRDIKGTEVKTGDTVLYASSRLTITHYAIGEITGFTKLMAKVDENGYEKKIKKFYKIPNDISKEYAKTYMKIFESLQ